jgi:hypothetical protein
MADCPMCTPNRFLSGALVWLPELQCCAVIGHCCADKEARDEAEREFKQRTKRDYEEEYLLRGLPLLPQKAAVLTQLRPAAEETRRLFRKLRREVPTVQKHLRDLKTRKGGHLILYEILSGAEDEMGSDYVGPSGFRGRGGSEVNSRDIEFGILAGMTAVTQDYNPVKDLDEIQRALESLGDLPTEEAVMDFICAMDERRRSAAVAILQMIDKRHARFVEKVADFTRFFTDENIARIHAYGTHTLNPFSIEAKLENVYGQRRLTIRHKDEISKLMLPSQAHDIDHRWPVAPEPDKMGNAQAAAQVTNRDYDESGDL